MQTPQTPQGPLILLYIFGVPGCKLSASKMKTAWKCSATTLPRWQVQFYLRALGPSFSVALLTRCSVNFPPSVAIKAHAINADYFPTLGIRSETVPHPNACILFTKAAKCRLENGLTTRPVLLAFLQSKQHAQEACNLFLCPLRINGNTGCLPV